MRTVSKKRQQLLRQADAARDRFAGEFPKCMVCPKPSTDTHEIARGSHRETAFANRITWLRLCRRCHEQLGDYSKWPLVNQYCLKALKDVEHYDRVALNEMRRKAADAISEREVWRVLPMVRAMIW